MSTTRREFLGTAAVTWGILGASGRGTGARPKVAALASTYHYLSHAYHIVGRFLDGFMVFGERPELHKPDFEVASLFIEQTPDGDLGRAKAERHRVRLSPTIEDALTLGTDKIAVDAVLLIAEHGDYPINEKLQKLYPRGRFFRDVLKVVERSGRTVPVFIDKHLSYDRAEARTMVAEAKRLAVPLMAGSSLPVTWRLPSIDPPLGQTWTDALVASRGEIEVFGFHALESLQCMVERRDRKGQAQGVVAVTCLEGDDVWKAGDAKRWSWSLLEEALNRSHTRNPGDVRLNTKDFVPPPGRPTFLKHPIAFLVEYADGLNAAALILNGHVDDTTIAGRCADGSIISTLFYLPAPPGANFFNPLVLRIEDFFRTGRPPYPVERTLLTGGILDAALESRTRGHQRVDTPDLATINYTAPNDSGQIKTSLAHETQNGK